MHFRPEQLLTEIYQAFEQVAAAGDGATPYWLALGATALCGLLYAFFGYRLYKVVLPLTGALGAAALGAYLWRLLQLQVAHQRYVQLGVVLIFALVGGLIAPKLFRFVTFLLGGAAMALTLHPLVGAVPQPYGWVVLLGGVAAGGFLSLLLLRFTLIVATAIGGAYILTASAFCGAIHTQLLPQRFNFLLFYAFWTVLAVAGIIVQLRHKPHVAPEEVG